MFDVVIEGHWFTAMTKEAKLLFLARLSHALTVAGRASYEPQTELLARPSDLRKVNEIQHRVSACMREILTDNSTESFEVSIAAWVLESARGEFQTELDSAWQFAKERVVGSPNPTFQRTATRPLN